MTNFLHGLGRRCGLVLWCAFVMIFMASPALAYTGPGAGLSAIGAVLALIGAVVLALVGFVWFPIKRLIAARKAGGGGKPRRRPALETGDDTRSVR